MVLLYYIFLFIILRDRPYFTLKTRTMPLILQGFVEHEIYWKKNLVSNEWLATRVYQLYMIVLLHTIYLRIVESWDGLKNDSTNVDWWGRNLSQRHLLVFCLSTIFSLKIITIIITILWLQKDEQRVIEIFIFQIFLFYITHSPYTFREDP